MSVMLIIYETQSYVLKTAQSVFGTVGLSECYISVWIIFMKFET